jgi:hypothetical protein
LAEATRFFGINFRRAHDARRTLQATKMTIQVANDRRSHPPLIRKTLVHTASEASICHTQHSGTYPSHRLPSPLLTRQISIILYVFFAAIYGTNVSGPNRVGYEGGGYDQHGLAKHESTVRNLTIKCSSLGVKHLSRRFKS